MLASTAKQIETNNADTAIAAVRKVIVDVFIFKKYVINIIIYNNINKSNTNKKPFQASAF